MSRSKILLRLVNAQAVALMWVTHRSHLLRLADESANPPVLSMSHEDDKRSWPDFH